MHRIAITLALFIGLMFTSFAQALPGPAPFETAIGEYDFSTGGIIVSVNEVTNWYIESLELNLNAADPLGIPAGGGVLTNNDQRIGETSLTPFTYTNVDLGLVAPPGLPGNPTFFASISVGLGDPPHDLSIFWATSPTAPLQSQPVIYTNVPEPCSLLLGAIASMGLLLRRRPVH